MYRLIYFLIIIAMSTSDILAQKDGFKYQGLARDANGVAITDQDISLKISILINLNGNCNGDAIFTETHQVQTNDLGLFWLTIGSSANVLNGNFSEIQWGSQEYCLQVEMDQTGGNNDFVDLGSSPLTSVPFALYALDVENKDDADADPNNELQSLSLDGTNMVISDGNAVDLAPIIPPGSSDDQELSLEGSNLSIEDGNTVNLMSIIPPELINLADSLDFDTISIREVLTNIIVNGNSDDQTIELSGTELSIEDGNTVDLMSIIPTEILDLADSIGFDTIRIREVLTSIIVNGNSDDQTIELSGTELSIEDGNVIDLMSIIPTEIIDLADSIGFDTIRIREVLTSILLNGNSDDQKIELIGTELSIEDGNVVDLRSIIPTEIIDLADSIGFDTIRIREVLTSIIVNGNSDNQNLTLEGTMVSIEDGNSIDLGSIIPDGGTDDQTLNLNGTNLSIEDGNSIDLGNIIPDEGTDDQTLNLNGTNLSIEDGNSIDLGNIIPDEGTDDQTLNLNGTNLSIENGNSVNLSVIQDGVNDDDNDPDNELQSLILNGNTLSITGKNSVNLPSSSSGWNLSGGDLNWTSTNRDFDINYNNSFGLRLKYRWEEGIGGYTNWSIGARYAINDKIYLTVNNQGHIGYNTNPETNAKVRLSHENINWGYSIENKSASNPWLWYQYSDADGANLGLAYDFSILGAFDPGTGAYSTVSDARVKKEIRRMDPILENLMKLESKSYVYKKDKSGKSQFGFIAQEVEKVFPELVTAPKVGGLGETHYTMNYAQFGVLAIKAIQEQQEIILNQQRQIDKQAREIEAIKNALNKAGIDLN